MSPARFLAFGLATCLLAPGAGARESYRARLSPMPVTPQTVDSITGEGEVVLILNGSRLSVAGRFAGMSSPATAAHIHIGPPAQPGPAALPLKVARARGGEVSGELELSDELREALSRNGLYIQIHSEINPPGELRGWIFPQSRFDG